MRGQVIGARVAIRARREAVDSLPRLRLEEPERNLMHRLHRSSIAAVLAMLVLGLLLTACGGGGGSNNTAKNQTITAANGKVTIVAKDNYFNASTINATAGKLQITLDNQGVSQHTFVIDTPKFKIGASPGSSRSGTIDVTAGSYAYYCDIPGHRVTMHGTLVVK
jgi:plastocyanin